MFSLLHNYSPSPLIVSFGPVNIYWYGLFVVLGTMAGLTISLKIAKKFKINSENTFDLAFWLIIWGLIGARIYHVFLEWGYYSSNFLNIFKIWQGGLAIHGGIIAALAVIIFYAHKNKISSWILAAIFAPALAVGQAIGRWGNYFNQELFGRPTDLPWGIPISFTNRPHLYLSSDYFHPTFLYESLGNIFIFFILLMLIKKILEKTENQIFTAKTVFLFYLIFYSILRFSLEFLRVDRTPEIFNLRWPQIISLLIIVLAIFFFFYKKKKEDARSETSSSLPRMRDNGNSKKEI